MSRILVCAFLAFAWAAAGQDKPTDTIDPEKLRAAQQRLAEKSPAGADAERLRIENERLKIELAAVRKELAELRKTMGLPPTNAKGKPLSVADAIKSYIADHPDLNPDVANGLRDMRPVPGMTMDEVRLFTGIEPSVLSETVESRLLLIGVNQPKDTATTYFRCRMRRTDEKILQVTSVGHGPDATTLHR